jgi:hypothetical protein|tara:strand:+ start:1623 stop:1850 length:228 start_codon:yes stop_codon:yes gene_type:complete
MKQPRILDALLKEAEANREKAITSIELLTEHPAGIGDHSTEDYYKNAREAVEMLADANEMIETIKDYQKSKKSVI